MTPAIEGLDKNQKPCYSNVIMTPLSINPSVVILMDEQHRPCAIASNIDPNVKVVVTNDRSVFTDESAGMPFDSSRPRQPQQTLSSAASKARHEEEAAALKAAK